MTTSTSPSHPLITRWHAADLVALLARRASDEHDATSIGFYTPRVRAVRTMRQRDFLRRAGGFARRLLDADVQPGDRVIVVCPQPEAALTAYLAAVMATAVPIIHAARPGFDDPSHVNRSLAELTDRLGHRTRVVAQTRLGRPIISLSGDYIGLDLEELPFELDGFAFERAAHPGQVLHLQATSGSTGQQKFVALTHDNVLVNCGSTLARMEFAADDHIVSWLPLFHDLGLVGMALNALLSGIDLTLLSPFDFLKDPACWLRVLSDRQGTMTASPNFGFEQVLRRVTDSRLDGLDLSRCRRMYCGGEPVDARTIARFSERFRAFGLPDNAVRATYGMAEATLMVSMPRIADAARFVSVPVEDVARLGELRVLEHQLGDALSEHADAARATIMSVGPAAEGVSIRLIDETGRHIDGPDRCGEIVVAGASVSPGYWQADASLESHGATGLRTGDIGFFHGEDLYIVERSKNTIIRNGHNYAATVLEAELARALDRPLSEVLVLDSDLRPGVGRVTAVVGIDRDDDAAAVHDRVVDASRAIEPTIEELLLVPRGALPRTTSGKKQHHRVRSMIQLGEFERVKRFDLVPVGSTPTDTIPEQILDIDAIDARNTVLRVLKQQAALRGVAREITESHELSSDLGFDSLAVYELAVTIEQALDLALPDEGLASVRRVGELLELVEACRREPRAAHSGVGDRLATIAQSVPQAYLNVRTQKARQLLVDDRWITDFASLNYLGLDLDPRVIRSVQPMLEEWGVHPSWTRAVASPGPYRELERQLARLVGAPDTVVFPTITLLHLGVLPKLAGSSGTILIDQGSHNSILEAAELARGRGATLVQVRRSDPDDLEAKLRQSRGDGPRIITVNGVYSMSGNIPDLRSYAELAGRYGATLYVDDAHGVGVLGERPDATRPFGTGGGGVVRHLGLDYDHIVYIAGLSKAFSSMAAFVTCHNATDRSQFEHASTMLFSGPIPVASLASALAGLRVNEIDGDAMRDRLWRLTARLIARARELGFVIDNDSGFPCVTPITGDIDRTVRACQILWQHGLLITPAVFPAMPLDRGGIRISVTASNTDSEIEQLLTGLEAVRDELGDARQLVGSIPRAGLFEF